ncbi:MAG: hypothetical protein ACYTEN_07145 [Planctomycetota bacterium]
MYKTKTITIVFLLLAMVVVSGCSGTHVRNAKTSEGLGHEETTHAAWYETESIDIDWPY